MGWGTVLVGGVAVLRCCMPASQLLKEVARSPTMYRMSVWSDLAVQAASFLLGLLVCGAVTIPVARWATVKTIRRSDAICSRPPRPALLRWRLVIVSVYCYSILDSRRRLRPKADV